MVTAELITNLMGPMGPVGEMARGTLSPTHDYFTTLPAGVYYTGGATAMATQVNRPGGETRPGTLIAFGNAGTAGRMQIMVPYQTPLRMWLTTAMTSSDPNSWAPWSDVLGNAAQQLPSDHNYLSASLPAGEYYSGGTVDMAGQTNKPDGAATRPGRLLVYGEPGEIGRFMVYVPYQTPIEYWVSVNQSSAGSFSPWENMMSSGGGGVVPVGGVNVFAQGTPNLMRLRAFMDEYPLVSTGNKGCVVFRYDHGLTNFKSTLLPLHQAAGISAYIAMNSRNWGIAENSGATQAEARAWANVEWGNHTADHVDRATADGIYDTIVNGRKELEAQLERIIHGFTVPGLSEFDKFEGFGGGSLDSYSDTLAGGLILANHAIASGSIGSTHRPLDGVIRQGGRHFTWEAQDFATIKEQIDEAVDTKTALTLMCHPRTMNGSGYWTPALAEEVIGYVDGMITSGGLANISYYQSHHATL